MIIQKAQVLGILGTPLGHRAARLLASVHLQHPAGGGSASAILTSIIDESDIVEPSNTGGSRFARAERIKYASDLPCRVVKEEPLEAAESKLLILTLMLMAAVDKDEITGARGGKSDEG